MNIRYIMSSKKHITDNTSQITSRYYTVNHKKGGSTFVIVTLENLDRF